MRESVVLLRAAIEFCAQDAIVRDYKDLPKCTEFDKGDPTIGDSGQPWCLDAEVPNPEAMCAGCIARYDGKAAYKTAIQRRNRAKQRMIREWRKAGAQ